MGRRGRTSVVGRGRRGRTLVVAPRGPTLAVGRGRRGRTLVVDPRGRSCQALAVDRAPTAPISAAGPRDQRGLTSAAGQGSTGLRCAVLATFGTRSPWADLLQRPVQMFLERFGLPRTFAPISGSTCLDLAASRRTRISISGGRVVHRQVCAGTSGSTCPGWPVPADTLISTSTGRGWDGCQAISAQASTGGWRLRTYASSSVWVTSSISAPTGEDCAFV